MTKWADKPRLQPAKNGSGAGWPAKKWAAKYQPCFLSTRLELEMLNYNLNIY